MESLKVYASILTIWVDFWDNKSEERINVRRHKEQKYFVNAILVGQNIKHTGNLSFTHSYLIPMKSLKI